MWWSDTQVNGETVEDHVSLDATASSLSTGSSNGAMEEEVVEKAAMQEVADTTHDPHHSPVAAHPETPGPNVVPGMVVEIGLEEEEPVVQEVSF